MSQDYEDSREEGEIPQDDRGDEWDDYVVPATDPPSPTSGTSSPEDIRGFHGVMERASKRFDLPIKVEQADCFLYDFREEARKSIRSIPIVQHVWTEGLKLMKTPASLLVWLLS